METTRSADSFLKNISPEEENGIPFRLAVFDQEGSVLYTTARGTEQYRVPEEDWAFLFGAERNPVANAESFGRTDKGRSWVSVATALPGKHTGTIALVALRDTMSHTDTQALALLARALRQHFSAQNTLEETRIKAQFDERIIRSISSGFVVLLPDTSILHINPAGARILGGNVDDLIGRRLDTILTSKLRVQEIIKTGKPIIDQEMMIHIGKRSIHIVKTAVAVFDDDGQVVAVMDLFKEIKEVRRLVNRMAGLQVRYTFDDILHRSPIMAETVEKGRTAAASSLSVLITGESGTGKELFAQAIHAASPRKNAPFVVIDCASMPRDLVEGELFGYMEGAFTGALKGGRPGKFELADGGTVFLDELGELPLELQSRFLRVLQSRQVMRLGGGQPVPVDIRVIAATNRNLLEQIRTKSFRDDLYYRLNVLSIHIPPLRSRPEDVLLLMEHFLKKYQIKMHRQGLMFTREAVEALLRNPWLGNVRELENTVARAVQICETEIRPEDLRPEQYVFQTDSLSTVPPNAASPVNELVQNAHQETSSVSSNQLRTLQAEFYLSTLRRHNGNIAETARSLGVARSTIYKKMRALGIDANTVCTALRSQAQK